MGSCGYHDNVGCALCVRAECDEAEKACEQLAYDNGVLTTRAERAEKEVSELKGKMVDLEQRTRDAEAERDSSRAMERAAERRAELLYQDRNATDEKLKDAVKARNEAVDCKLGGGSWSCGRCLACLSRVNAHLHEESMKLLTEREKALADSSLRSAMLLQVGAALAQCSVVKPSDTSDPRWTPTLREAHRVVSELNAAHNEIDLVVSASLLCEGERLVEPPGMRGRALAAMLNTVHRAHEAEKHAPLCECGKIATCIGSDETGIRCCCDECCGHGQEDSSCVPVEDVVEWVRKREDQLEKELVMTADRAESAELGCEIAYRREPTADEAEAFKFDRGDGTIVETHVPAGNWHGHRCTCGKWVWGGGTVCQGCIDAQAVRTALDREAQAKRQGDEDFAKMMQERNAALAALRDRDARLGRVATRGTGIDEDGDAYDICGCCAERTGHRNDCPLAGWEPYHEP